MSSEQALIPPPPVVRARLAEHNREGRLLRALYRLSVRAAQEQQQEAKEEAKEMAKGLLHLPDKGHKGSGRRQA